MRAGARASATAPHPRAPLLGPRSGHRQRRHRLALAAERPQWRVTGVDISPAALEVAAGNSHKLGARAHRMAPGCMVRAGGGRALRHDRRQSALCRRRRSRASESWRRNPPLRLRPDRPGSRRCPPSCARRRRICCPQGWLMLEHGGDQAPDVAQLLERHGFTGIRTLLRFFRQTPRHAGSRSNSTQQEPL